MPEETTKLIFRIQVEELILTINSKDKLADKQAVDIAIDPKMIEPGKPMSMTLEDLNKAVGMINDVATRYCFDTNPETNANSEPKLDKNPDISPTPQE